MPDLQQYFRRHIPRCPACCREDIISMPKNFRQSKISNHNIRIDGLVFKQEVFGFEVSMDDFQVMQICDTVENLFDKICSIFFRKIGSKKKLFEQLATTGQVSYEIDCI